ncbi:MAG: NAD-dependent epimerase/dehydratase family protein [Desulfatiglandaceae bacterium]
MKILVTGGAGFIGSNVVDGYVRAGHEVLVVDNLYTGKRSNLNPEARFYELDIRSPEAVKVIERERPDVLNHHAAQMSVPDSVSDPIFDADINIKGFLNLLEGAARYKIKKVIFISSGGAIYGETSEYPTSEDCRPRPLSPYAVTKYCSEHYLAFYNHQYGLDYTTLRYANIYGPRQIRHGEAGVVAIFMDNLLKGVRSTLNHFPDDKEGMVRDYCYVEDVVKANLSALDRGGGDFFNIGTGLGTKTLALYEMIFEAFKVVEPRVSEELVIPIKRLARPGDLTKSCLVVEKASGALGWTPETDLAEGIRKTIEWRLNQPV